MKIKLLLCVVSIIAQTAFSQKGRGHVTLLKKNESVNTATNRIGHVTLLRFTQIYLGGGIFMPSPKSEDSGSVKGTDINLAIYQPIWSWVGKSEKNGLSVGANLGGSYTNGNGNYDFTNHYTVYNMQGQSAPPTVSERGSGSPKQAGFKIEAGPQMNIHLGSVTLAPIFNLGYLRSIQKAVEVSETLHYNGNEYTYTLLNQKEIKTNGLGIIPKVRITYNITPRIGLWAEGNYIIGPKTTIETTRFVLDPTIPSDSYNLGHFEEGQYITTQTTTNYSGLGINGGVVVGIETMIRKHTCLICGGKHRGKCKQGYADDNISAIRISPTDCVGYLCSDSDPENCSCTSGTCCLKEIIVNSTFDLLSFDKLVIANDEGEIRKLFQSDLKTIGLEALLQLQSGQEIVNGIVNGHLILVKAKSSGQKYNYLLKTATSAKNDYVGHVTLLR